MSNFYTCDVSSAKYDNLLKLTVWIDLACRHLSQVCRDLCTFYFSFLSLTSYPFSTFSLFYSFVRASGRGSLLEMAPAREWAIRRLVQRTKTELLEIFKF